ncbi:uncharacterized protein Socs36E [Drosophila tropicalis]|uniref:uncharacterized protein Socs36E n=1 Tax=Drosophila tropicalis TaxID=46794 RepID=UPI0035AC0D3F
MYIKCQLAEKEEASKAKKKLCSSKDPFNWFPMGHHLSKPTIAQKSIKNNQKQVEDQKQGELLEIEQRIHLQSVDEGVAAVTEETSNINTNSTAEVRQIIIKIQLAKMENGNNGGQVLEREESQRQGVTAAAAIMSATDTLNANEQQQQQQQIVNVTLGGSRTAGSSSSTTTTEEAQKSERQQMNNNNLAGIASTTSAISTLQLKNDDQGDEHYHHQQHHNDVDNHNDDVDDDHDADDDDDVVDESLLRRRDAPTETVDYCEVEVLETLPVSEMLSTGTQQITAKSTNGNSCCRSRSNKILSMGANTSNISAAAATTTTGAAAATTQSSSSSSRRRCCKCKCRDALKGLRGILESGSNTLRDKKESAIMRKSTASAASSSSSTRPLVDRRSTPATSSTMTSRLQTQRKRNSVAVPPSAASAPVVAPTPAAPASAESNQLAAIWSSPSVIIHISSPQCVIESPGNARVTVSPHFHVSQMIVSPTPQAQPATTATAAAGTATVAVPAVPGTHQFRVTVHSQIDFMHCLVPDLEKIINSSFYWGKMDRYEAERLLEGKPEGTFLLRDSAQEEFLFSVTFRKYGRSLHARIEQSGHKFSFDCHDPCVFTASTVTGLLEHYKDPTCVMFFEPCLTMPLHRRQTFSLQQLARATIVSNTSYDGINQLELPGRLKSYLKEYHYKQKLRVKPCDQNTPGAFYANV